MKTSSSVGLLTLTAWISPGNASTTPVMKRWPFSSSIRTWFASVVASTLKRVLMRCAKDSAFARGVQQNDVAADFVFQVRGRAQRHQFAFIQDGEAIATLGFFHQVRGDDDRDALLGP